MTSTVDKYELKPGQWIIFTHEAKELPPWSSRPYRVIKRGDSNNNIGCCYKVMNEEGKIGKYCAKTSSIDDEFIPFGHKIKILTQVEVKELLEKTCAEFEKRTNMLMSLSRAKL